MTSMRLFIMLLSLGLLSACGGSSSSDRQDGDNTPRLAADPSGDWRGIQETAGGALRTRRLITDSDGVTFSQVGDDLAPVAPGLGVAADRVAVFEDDNGQALLMLLDFDHDGALLVDDQLAVAVLSRQSSLLPLDPVDADALNGEWQGMRLARQPSGAALSLDPEHPWAAHTLHTAQLECSATDCVLSGSDMADLTLDISGQRLLPGLVEFSAAERVWDAVEAGADPAPGRTTLMLSADQHFLGGYHCPHRQAMDIDHCHLIALHRAP